MREANDRGYECLILSDCTGATDPANHDAALQMVTMQGGVFGAWPPPTTSIEATTREPPMTSRRRRSPYPFTFDPATTALVVIDMQRDFLEPGGFGETLGNDVSLLQPVVAAAAEVLAAARAVGHARSSTPARGTCPTCPTARRPSCSRGEPSHAASATRARTGRILVRGEYGHDIIDELAPDRPASWSSTSPARARSTPPTCRTILRDARASRSLIVTGVTTEVCVHTTVREANDRGYECLVLSDCVGSYFPEFQRVGLEMIAAQGGIFGWVAPTRPRSSPRCTARRPAALTVEADRWTAP